MITVHESVKHHHAGAHFGVLILRGFQPISGTAEAFRAYAAAELEKIRQNHPDYDRKVFSAENPIIAAYVRYYKKFKKSYHVLHQIESILKGKEIPDAFPLIQALFLAELQTSMLIAGHDLEKSVPPFSIECSQGGETYTGAGEQDITLKPDDISMRDQAGFILSIIYGQDRRTRITEHTSDVLYLIDGVPGIEKAVYENTLEKLLAAVRIFHPGIEPVQMNVLEA